MSKPYKYVCAYCGGDNVNCSANVVWDVPKQEWVIAGDPLDDDFCEDCDGECNLEQVFL